MFGGLRTREVTWNGVKYRKPLCCLGLAKLRQEWRRGTQSACATQYSRTAHQRELQAENIKGVQLARTLFCGPTVQRRHARHVVPVGLGAPQDKAWKAQPNEDLRVYAGKRFVIHAAQADSSRATTVAAVSP